MDYLRIAMIRRNIQSIIADAPWVESHLTPNAVHISDNRPMHTIQMSDPVGASLLWRVFEYDCDLPGASLCVLRTNTGKAEDNENPQ